MLVDTFTQQTPPSFSSRAEGSNILLDPQQECKKTHKVSKKVLEICRQDSRNKTSLLKKIVKGISLGFRECESQFRHRKWNCTSNRKSIRKILLRGTLYCCCWWSHLWQVWNHFEVRIKKNIFLQMEKYLKFHFPKTFKTCLRWHQQTISTSNWSCLFCPFLS